MSTHVSIFVIMMLIFFTWQTAAGQDHPTYKVLFSNDSTNIETCTSPYHEKGQSWTPWRHKSVWVCWRRSFSTVGSLNLEVRFELRLCWIDRNANLPVLQSEPLE